ncbi:MULTISPECIES: alpha/beta hydrolase family esterase [unclassified Rathayibacter]|uniref:alpha/beta hydrolase family esterase n=1 Tax=unclassified Rathayibacter TaxID=2609250 RepID=UPI00194E1CE1|nr:MULTISPECIES: PHB depolymerase family esterase [unclassified Rathayibacter]
MSPSPSARRTRSGLLSILAVTALAAGGVGVAGSASAATGADCVRSLPAGDSTVAVAFGGTTYDVLMHVPADADDGALPLVLDLHGSNSNGGVQAGISDLASVADDEGFIVANPTGAIEFEKTLEDGNWAWNVPGVPLTSGTFPPEGSRDDVAFLSTVVETLSAQGCVDAGSVFATGFSGGGRMASALACTRADLFAAVAPVAGLRAGRADLDDLTTIEAGSCTPSRPVSVLTFHGTADAVNPFEGNTDPRWGYSVATATAGWAGLDDCEGEPVTTAVTAEVGRAVLADCADGTGVEAYAVEGGGHTWPGTAVDLEASGLGVVNRTISASALMWDFFAAHARTVEPTPEPTATPTAQPTATPEPTATARPTAAPEPTATAQPTASPSSSPSATPIAHPSSTGAGPRGGALAETGTSAVVPLGAAAMLLAAGAVLLLARRRRA